MVGEVCSLRFIAVFGQAAAANAIWLSRGEIFVSFRANAIWPSAFTVSGRG